MKLFKLKLSSTLEQPDCLGEGLYHNTYPPGKNGEGIVETTAKTGNVTGGIAKLAIVSKRNSIYSEIQILL